MLLANAGLKGICFPRCCIHWHIADMILLDEINNDLSTRMHGLVSLNCSVLLEKNSAIYSRFYASLQYLRATFSLPGFS